MIKATQATRWMIVYNVAFYLANCMFMFSACLCRCIGSSKSFVRKLLALGAVLHIVGNAAATVIFLYISHHNYAGGVAIRQLHQIVSPDTGDNIGVFLCVHGFVLLWMYIKVNSGWGGGQLKQELGDWGWEMGDGRQGSGSWDTVDGRKNSLWWKLTLYGGRRWGERWERVPSCPPPPEY